MSAAMAPLPTHDGDALAFRTSSSHLLHSPTFRCSFRKTLHSSSAHINLSFSGVARDCAVGATAGCAALCCCCPFSLLSLLGLAFVKLPRLVFRKVSRFRGREEKELSPNPSSLSDDDVEFVPAMETLVDTTSPLFQPFIAGTGFGVFAEEEYWNEVFGFDGSEFASEKQRDGEMIPAL